MSIQVKQNDMYVYCVVENLMLDRYIWWDCFIEEADAEALANELNFEYGKFCYVKEFKLQELEGNNYEDELS